MMTLTSASAPGKIILCGEHAVVYGRPAIAVPIGQVRATATVAPAPPGAGLVLQAPDLNQVVRLGDAPPDQPLAAIVRLTLAHLRTKAPDVTLTVRSTIPVASGMGSSAAISTACARALALYLGAELDAPTLATLVYEVEKLHHGTPSGIDNTVIAYEHSLVFVRDQPPERLRIRYPFHLLIADTGVPSLTRIAVGDVRRAWQADPALYEHLFEEIGEIVRAVRSALETGDLDRLGPLLSANQERLRQIGVSSPELERLITAALDAGATGAKLCGGGRGGNMIALVAPLTQNAVAEALRAAGATRVLHQEIEANDR
jgi:mevalonate kinase